MIFKLINDLQQIDKQFIEDLENGSIFISFEFKNPKDTPQKIKTIMNLLSGQSAGHKCNKYIIKTTYQKIVDLSNSKLRLVQNNLNKILRLELYSIGDKNLYPNIKDIDGFIIQLLLSENYQNNILKIVNYLKLSSVYLEDKDFKLEIDNNGIVRSLYLFINISKYNQDIQIINMLKKFNFIFSVSPCGKFIFSN